ncbi:hypothetical protein [Streptomyces sp. NPDC001820]|uniref:hypothetical protein n=1 Tax=Streptomyces sp. NPDC001820 TaxID=3364613 RepID=UPI0036B1CC43
MTPHSPYENTWLGVFEEMRNCTSIRMSRDHQGPLSLPIGDAPKAFADLAEWENIQLEPSLQRCYLRFSNLAACWGTDDSESDPLIAGEFDITHIYKALTRDAPDPGWADPSVEERQMLPELRAFDGTTMTGAGHLTMLRIQRGVGNPQVWFNKAPFGPHLMDIDYCGYLEALRITKGTFGWQFLFTEVSLADSGHEATTERLTNMLDVFPGLFPDHDYEPLRARLADRLR